MSTHVRDAGLKTAKNSARDENDHCGRCGCGFSLRFVTPGSGQGDEGLAAPFWLAPMPPGGTLPPAARIAFSVSAAAPPNDEVIEKWSARLQGRLVGTAAGARTPFLGVGMGCTAFSPTFPALAQPASPKLMKMSVPAVKTRMVERVSIECLLAVTGFKRFPPSTEALRHKLQGFTACACRPGTG